jgi:hypothetical protein
MLTLAHGFGRIIRLILLGENLETKGYIMQRRLWMLLVAFSLVVFGLQSSYAKPKKAGKSLRAAVLPLVVKDFPKTWSKSLGAAIGKELKSYGVFRLVPPRAVRKMINRLKKKKVFKPGCENKKKCIKVVGKALKAKILYFVDISQEGSQAKVGVRAYEVKSGNQIKLSSELTGKNIKDVEKALRWVVRRVSSPMISKLAAGKVRLQINCEHSDADLYIKGKNYGKRTGMGLKVPAGAFDVEVRKEGYKPFHEVVVFLPSKKNIVMTAKLEADADAFAPVPLVSDAAAKKEEARKKAEAEAAAKEAAAKEKAAQEAAKKEVPAWAAFDKKKDKKAEDAEKEKVADKAKPKTWDVKPLPKAHLPGKEEEELFKKDIDEDESFYETWWFWTIVSVAVAGGGGATAYFLLAGEAEAAQTGSALVSWE